ncbi:hypothetical protein GUITHDRAFT_156735, partial [Guillardia theta CCMP2712]
MVKIRNKHLKRLEEVLELAVSSSLRVRGGMHDADEMLRDVADELEGKRAKSSQDLTGSEERGRGKERTGNGDDEELVRVERMLGLALTEVLREDLEDACAALAQHIRRLLECEEKQPGGHSEATRRWAMLFEQGWLRAARMTSKEGREEEAARSLLSKLTGQLDALEEVSQELRELELAACIRRMAAV